MESFVFLKLKYKADDIVYFTSYSQTWIDPTNKYYVYVWFDVSVHLHSCQITIKHETLLYMKHWWATVILYSVFHPTLK